MLYDLYTRRLRRQLGHLPKPAHVAIVMDGNRRWARGAGYDDVRVGHRSAPSTSSTSCSGARTRASPA